jgi:hypothetical protein
MAGIYLLDFICSLFNNAASNLNYTALNDWMTTNNELKKMWIEEVAI